MSAEIDRGSVFEQDAVRAVATGAAPVSPTERVATAHFVRQQLFDRAVKGVLRQGRAAKIDRTCVMIAPDGARSPIGYLLPAGYVPADNRILYTLFRDERLAHLRPYADFLYDLEIAHDEAADWNCFLIAFRDNCRELAKEWWVSLEVFEDDADGR